MGELRTSCGQSVAGNSRANTCSLSAAEVHDQYNSLSNTAQDTYDAILKQYAADTIVEILRPGLGANHRALYEVGLSKYLEDGRPRVLVDTHSRHVAESARTRVHAWQPRQMRTTLNGTCNTASGWVGGAVGAPNAPLCVWNSVRGRGRRLYLICSGPDADARVVAAACDHCEKGASKCSKVWILSG